MDRVRAEADPLTLPGESATDNGQTELRGVGRDGPRRTQEIGIRMALGADRAAILRLILRQGLAGVGLFVGLALAAVATPAMASQLAGVGPTDAVSFAIAVAVLMGAALVATYIPAPGGGHGPGACAAPRVTRRSSAPFAMRCRV